VGRMQQVGVGDLKVRWKEGHRKPVSAHRAVKVPFTAARTVCLSNPRDSFNARITNSD